MMIYIIYFREAGCTPFAASIIADYFNAESRGFALGIYNWGIYMGYSMSSAFGNFITDANINNQVTSTSIMILIKTQGGNI